MAPRPRSLIISALALLAAIGCGEELGPEVFKTARVRGTVRAAGRPIGGGFLTIQPAEGNTGNLAVAPIRSDGSFVVDRVPVGRVAIGVDQAPAESAPPWVNLRDFRAVESRIRRTIPDRPESTLTIDLAEESARDDRRKPRPRRKDRSRRPSPEPDPPEEEDAPVREPVVRVIYRESGGAVHLDWPLDRVASAIGDAGGTAWVDIEDIESASNDRVEAMLRDVFRFHPLAIEDALKDTQVPKVDDWGDYLYIVVDTIDFDPETDDLRLHELDLFLGSNFLVTYHNEPMPVLDRLRRNVRHEPEVRLGEGAGHLLSRLLDDVATEFLPAIQHLDDAIDDAQDEVFNHPTPDTLRRIFHVKSCALRLFRTVIPMREVLNRLARDPYRQVRPEHRVYFRDAYDQLVRVHDIMESLRDLISGALDTYLSVVSNRTNDIMKALTIVNVMFLPMTFLAGFFGMNFFGPTLAFESPALPRAWLFWATVGLMAATPPVLWRMAHKRGWFG